MSALFSILCPHFNLGFTFTISYKALSWRAYREFDPALQRLYIQGFLWGTRTIFDNLTVLDILQAYVTMWIRPSSAVS